LKAQITFEFIIWASIGALFVLSTAVIVLHIYSAHYMLNSSSMVSNLSNLINVSIYPYSQFGVRVV